MGNRRKAREIALQALYMNETVNTNLETLLKYEWLEKEPENKLIDFATSLISGVLDNQQEYDNLIVKYSKNWKFDRISSIEKSILRMSLHELLNIQDIPPAISINEAIELGKIYGGENSGQFINGILDSVNKKEKN